MILKGKDRVFGSKKQVVKCWGTKSEKAQNINKIKAFGARL